MSGKRINLLIVDDSAVVRQVVAEMLGSDPAIHILGVAADPILAMAKMKSAWPDVILLDIEMPKMDGLTFLRQIMATRPTPVVICSTLTESGTRTALDALSAGAVTTVAKPRLGIKQFLTDSTEHLASVIKTAARANVRQLAARARQVAAEPKRSADAVLPPVRAASMAVTTERVVAIGTSTGGTQALEEVLGALPPMAPGIVVVQHMPEKFTAAFAARLDSICRIRVHEARSGMRVLPGSALIAPGGKHMVLKRSGAQYYVDVMDGPLVNRHRPSVDVLFRSVARCAGANALGIIMTGMGDDGAAGMFELKRAGAQTLAQDEQSCVVYGMPKEAVRRGGVDRSLPLSALAGEIVRQLSV